MAVSLGLRKTKLQNHSILLHSDPYFFFAMPKCLSLFFSVGLKKKEDTSGIGMQREREISILKQQFFAMQNPLFSVETEICFRVSSGRIDWNKSKGHKNTGH